MTAEMGRPPRTSTARKKHDAAINLRVAVSTRNLIDTAAAVSGKTRSEFMIETARKRAIDVLLDQRLFSLDESQHDAFMRVLDAPAQPSEKLKQLMNSKAPWD